MFGKCIDCYLPDALIYGLASGYFGYTKTVMDAAGLFTKWANSHGNADSLGHALPVWEVGRDIGKQAHDDPSYVLSRDDPLLGEFVQIAPSHVGCEPCTSAVPRILNDWPEQSWNQVGDLAKGAIDAWPKLVRKLRGAPKADPR